MQLSWHPIGRAQGTYGATHIPIRALYEPGLKILGPENFERQLSWSPIDKAQCPYGAVHIPIRALYEVDLKISRV